MSARAWPAAGAVQRLNDRRVRHVRGQPWRLPLELRREGPGDGAELLPVDLPGAQCGQRFRISERHADAVERVAGINAEIADGVGLKNGGRQLHALDGVQKHRLVQDGVVRHGRRRRQKRIVRCHEEHRAGVALREGVSLAALAEIAARLTQRAASAQFLRDRQAGAGDVLCRGVAVAHAVTGALRVRLLAAADQHGR
jgi:hypothetical protein